MRHVESLSTLHEFISRKKAIRLQKLYHVIYGVVSVKNLLKWCYNKVVKKKLSNQLQEFDNTRRIMPQHKRNRLDAPKQFLTNCIYMVDLAKTMKMIIPYYWNPGKTILDFTAGNRLIWRHFLYNHLSSCGFEHWHVDFNDISPEAKAETNIPVQQIDQLPHHDIGVLDLPFTELKNGVESFGVRAKTLAGRIKTGAYNQHFRREFYFRNFEPLPKVFSEIWKPINKVCDNLIIKIGDSHKGKRLVSNVWYAERFFDHEKNPESEFQLIDRISYRGNYARRGGRFPFAQAVTSYYLIFKKNVDYR